MNLYPYLGIIVFLILTGCGLPVPEEVPIIGAGVAAGLGKLDVWLAFASCMVGALIGDTVMYAMGRFFGHGMMRSGWFSSILNEANEQRAERMIRDHGLKVFFVARFLVGVRAPMYIAAGILRVPLTRFLLIDGICATVVISVVFGLSWYFGKDFQAAWEWIHQSQVALTVVVVSIAVIVGLYVLWLWRKHVRAKAEEAAKDDPAPVKATGQLDHEPVAHGKVVSR